MSHLRLLPLLTALSITGCAVDEGTNENHSALRLDTKWLYAFGEDGGDGEWMQSPWPDDPYLVGVASLWNKWFGGANHADFLIYPDGGKAMMLDVTVEAQCSDSNWHRADFIGFLPSDGQRGLEVSCPDGLSIIYSYARLSIEL